MYTTLAQKILSRAAGHKNVHVGDVIVAKVDLAMIHDSGGPRRVAPILQELKSKIFDPSKVVLISDHFVSSGTAEGNDILKFTRKWAKQEKVPFYDEQGICHVVLPERGHLNPGMLVVGGDSHSPTGGAFGSYMFGIGATEMAGVLATGEIWIKVPETILLNWSGRLRPAVMAKDMMLFLCRKLGMDGGRYQAIEFSGNAIEHLTMQERMTLSNMTAELGAQVGLIAPDKKTEDYLQSLGNDPGNWQTLFTEIKADGIEHHNFDASELEPQVAAPHSPSNSSSIGDIEKVNCDVAYIGACTGAKYTDLKAAATILKDRTVVSTTKLIVAPASLRDQNKANANGVMKILEDAGATFLPNACGICAGYGTDRLASGIKCISSTARNFRGRMGADSSEVWLGSPMTVAASAINGVITDPREFLKS